MNKYLPAKYKTKIPVLNSFFPGISGYGQPDKNAKITANIENDPRNLNKYRAPYQVIRLKIDPSFWKDAISEAERPLSSLPYRVKMQTMFLETINNGFVHSCIQKRKNLTLLKKYHICDEKGVTNEAATKLITSNWFQRMREYIHDAQYYGYTLITFGDFIDGEFPKLQMSRRTDVSPDRECLSTQPYIPTGINFNDPEYKSPNGESPYDWSLWVPTHSEAGISTCGYGLLYKVAPYEIIMRSILGWNADYIERFGQPTTVIKTVDNNEVERARAEEAARGLASNPYMILNINDQFELIGDSNAGTGWKSYDNYEGRCKKIISSVIFGHEDGLTTTAGKMAKDDEESPAAKALIACEVLDSHFEEYIINDFLIPKLIKIGINIPVGTVYKIRNDSELHEENENKAKQAQAWANIALAFSQAGVTIDVNELSTLSGLKLTEAQIQQLPNLSDAVKNKLKKIYAGVKK